MSAGLDLGFDDAQQAIHDAIASFCRDRCTDDVVKAAPQVFPRTLWRELAELGVLAIATPEGEGGAVELARSAALGDATRARALAQIALAAYLAAAGRCLVDAASEHAKTRRQFGRAIGSFQAVAHPLANAVIALDAASTLARVAAWEGDATVPGSVLRAAAAQLSATRAAESAAHTAHQVFGALGVMRDGPAYFATRRIVQLAATPPGARRARETVLTTAGPS